MSHDSSLPAPRVLELVSPHDGARLEPVPIASAADVRAAVDRARVAQDEWAQVPLADRIARLKAAARTLLERRDEIIALTSREMGKVAAEGLFNEALGPLDAVSNWGALAKRELAPQRVRLNPLNFPGKRARIELVPRGVVGIIAPWNFPVAGLYRSVLPALLAGNAVVLKPSEYSPRSSGWFVERLAEHLPPGLASVVPGDASTGEALLRAGIDAAVFTGSPRAGRSVRAVCAELDVPVSCELGGNDPAIVLADCDLPRTVACLTQWSLSNAGQACGAIELAFVDRSIADELVRRLAVAFERLRTAPALASELEVAPLANARQLAVVEDHVADAIAKGAKLVAGGVRGRAGFAYRPTLLDHCDERMKVVSDETFGPVLAVVRVDGPADAVRRANALAYGLGASVWTSDLARGERLAERLDYGVVTINNHSVTGAMPELPWSGVRGTGRGVANSRYSFATFVRPKTVLVDESKSPELYFFPYDDTLRELGGLLADAQLGRLGGAWKIPLLLQRRVATVKRFFGFGGAS